MLKSVKNESGVTLVELIIVLAIIGIVVTMASSVQLFGLKTFNMGQDQYNSQYNIRRASEYITKELRYAQTMEILSAVPAAFETGKKYIYVDGSSIKNYKGGLDIIIVHDSASSFTPSIIFNESPVNSKILNFEINGIYDGQNFSISTEVLPVNIAATDPDPIMGVADGIAISYGPFTDAEIVEVDKILLNIKDINTALAVEADGSFTLPYIPPIPPAPPVPLDFIFLQSSGENSSTITWSSSNPSVVLSDGNVTRPAAGSGDKTVILTATIKKTTGLITEQTTKSFTVKICQLE
jgi:prepilin-type N-terminal cleavage/methylation domain-containing protein